MEHIGGNGNLSEQAFQKLVKGFNENDNTAFLGHRLDHLFEMTVEEFPDNVALIHEKSSISYKDLNSSANLFARGLQGRGLGYGDVVGLAVSRSIDLIVATIAVLKLGAAYVPIDLMLPAQRIEHMIENAKPKFLLVDKKPAESLASWTELCLDINQVKVPSTPDTSNLDVKIHHKDLAYIIYTSGSTGRPKGVEVSHGAAANFLCSLREHEPGCSSRDRLLAITTISFDMSVLEMYLPILSGATMIIANANAIKDPHELLHLIKTHEVTMLQATPATWTMLWDCGWRGIPRLSKILCGGEPLSRRLADRLLASADSVWNVYGPAETTYGSIGRVGADEIVVGNPVVNGRIYVLGNDLYPVPVGCEGEVYIGGASVSNGYRSQVELTRSRFLENPYHSGIFFRTGDLAKFVDYGKLQVIGRSDGVVKLRGNRIDVGDVEAALTDHPLVTSAAVVHRDDRLVAYCVVQDFYSNHNRSLETMLRAWVTERLPSYMVPAFFVSLDKLPLSPSQKLDRKALPNPIDTLQRNHIITVPVPTSVMEKQIQGIWSAILGHEQFSIDDSFFHVGGDSVRIIRMQAALAEHLNRFVPTPELFQHFTIKTLAAYLTEKIDNANTTQCDPSLTLESNNFSEGIAVVSMACRLPGSVTTPEELWQVFHNGRETIVEVPKERWATEKGYYSEAGAEFVSYCRRGGFLHSLDSFDGSFFGISPREACAMDPEQHLILELCWEALERAGYTTQLDGSATGVFIGVSKNGTTRNQTPMDLDGHSISGTAEATLSGRLSYTFNFRGPNLTIDTACSSSLVATHLACNALRHGECDMALVGGVSLLINPAIHIEFSKLGGISADGRCRAFSDDADGTGFSEGAVTMVLKRLSDAKRDGDIIHAVLRGTAVLHGGRSVSLTAPNVYSQQSLVKTALKRSSIGPEDIDYVEAHGTATKLGDPIEAAALAEVFKTSNLRKNPLWVGSAKSNIGHTQAAAGLVGLLKVVLSLKNNTLPKTLHVKKPTRAIDWEKTNLGLITENRSWNPNMSRPRRAGVSSFGLGGTIAHIIVEEFSANIPERNGDFSGYETPATLPFLLSAASTSALKAQAVKLQSHLESEIGKIQGAADIAYSLATSRTHFQKRLALVAAGKEQLISKLRSVASEFSNPPHCDKAEAVNITMLFTGQGSQKLGMGKVLYKMFPSFQTSLNQIAAEFIELDHSLQDVMWSEPGSPTASLLDRTDYAQPALFAFQVALWKLWSSWGVKPAFLLGHSVGEFAVAHVSGILSLKDACRLVLVRSQLMQEVAKQGKMLAIEMDGDKVKETIQGMELTEKVQIAAYNTPSQTVISGDATTVNALADYFGNTRTKVLDTSRAFHSHHMDGIMRRFEAVLRTTQFSPPTIPIISSMTGKLVTADDMRTAEYWMKQARDAVQMTKSFKTLFNQGANVFLEVGPGSTLCSLGAASLLDAPQTEDALWLPSMKGDMEDASGILQTASMLHIRNVYVDWSTIYQSFNCKRVILPTYAFQRKPLRPVQQHNGHVVQRFENGNKDLNGNSNNRTNNNPFENLKSMMYFVAWHPILSSPPFPSQKWGVLVPSSTTVWTTHIQKALSITTWLKLFPMQDLRQASGLDGILYLWDTTTSVVDTAHQFTVQGLSHLQQIVETGFVSLPLVWITHHAIGTGDGDTPLNVGAAPLLGLVRSARSEHPDLRLSVLDADEATDATAVALNVLRNQVMDVAIRDGRLLGPQLERVDSSMTRKASLRMPKLVRKGGAVLITGGSGYIGRQVAERLVSSHGIRDLVLFSRRGMDAVNAGDGIDRLSELGAQITVIAGDVSDSQSLASVLGLFNSERPLRGIVHAAGVVDSGTLSTLTPHKCISTLTPKVNGLWNLHEQTKGLSLDFFVMFSSISGVIGLPGLANYAAANSFVDMLAYMRHSQGLPATSLAYGPWDGDGMITTLIPTTRSHLSQFGMELITPQIGLDLFEQAVVSGSALTAPAILDLERLKMYYESQGGVPSFLKTLLGLPSISQTASMTMSLQNMLLKAAPETHADIVLRKVQETTAKILGHSGAESLDIDRSLRESGIDSLTSVLIRNSLTKLTGVPLPPNLTFLYPTPRLLSEYILSETRHHTEKPSINGHNKAPTQNIDILSLEKGVLDRSIQFHNISDQKSSNPSHPKTVFITGATGFFGAFMVHEFLEQNMQVCCLTRASTASEAQHRVMQTLIQYDLWNAHYVSALQCVPGDLSEPLLGLSLTSFTHLAETTDYILHSGALVDWMRPLPEYTGPNILGTHEVLRLASLGRPKTIHFISTISTLPIHLGYGLSAHSKEYGYGTSKYVAEKLVAAARFRGATAKTYRLPFVGAASESGQFRRDRGDFLHNLIMAILEMGVFPRIDECMEAVLPVDYLCRTVASIMMDCEDGRADHNEYDFLNAQAPTFVDFFEAISGEGSALEFEEWYRMALSYAEEHPESCVARVIPVMDGYTNETAGDMLKGSVISGCMLGSDVYPCPPLDEGYVQRYLQCIMKWKAENE